VSLSLLCQIVDINENSVNIIFYQLKVARKHFPTVATQLLDQLRCLQYEKNKVARV